MSEESGFLSRWAERKRRVQDESEQLVDETKQVAVPDAPAEDEFEGKTDDEILAVLELPAPESLKLGDSVAGFMDARVPERIRHKALRAFWKTNPVLANIDGLDEYCEDFTDAATVVENLQTIYQVGKGYASQALDVLESLAEEGGDQDAEALQPSETQDQRIDHQADQEPKVVSDSSERIATGESSNGELQESANPAEELAQPLISPPPLGRRMQFRS